MCREFACFIHSFIFFFFVHPDNVESAVVDLTELLLLDVIIWVGEAVRALSFYAISLSLTGTLSLSLIVFMPSLDIRSVQHTRFQFLVSTRRETTPRISQQTPSLSGENPLS